MTKSRRFQFGIRTLFVVTTLCAMVLAAVKTPVFGLVVLFWLVVFLSLVVFFDAFFSITNRGLLWLAVGSLVAVAAGYTSNLLTADACKRTTRDWLEAGAGAPGPLRKTILVEPSTSRFPYLASVDYSWYGGPTDIRSGRRYYLCLFGLPIGIFTTRQTVT